MQPAPHHRRRRASLRKRTILPAAVASLLPALHSPAATVSWAVDSNGTWTTPANWSTGALPGPTSDVMIDRPDGTYGISFSSGTQSIHSLTSNENLTVSGGILAVATTAQIGGALKLNGGTLSGGTWTTTGGGTITAAGTLSGVILGGNLTVPSGTVPNATLAVTNGLTLADGTITLSSGNGSSYLYFNGTQTLGGTGTLHLGGFGVSNYISSSGGLTIAPGITIATSSGSGSISLGASSVNRGTVSSQINDYYIDINGTNWTNAGTLTAINGGVLTLHGLWSNTGTINVGSGSKLGLNGTFTTAGIGTLINNGTVSIDGTLNNTGNAVTLSYGAGNGFALNDLGTIVGGTVNTTSGGAAGVGTLNGVTLGGDLVVPNTALTVTNGLTLAGGSITLRPTSSSYSSTLKFSGRGALTLGGTGTIFFAGAGSDSITGSGGLTFAPGVTIATYFNSGSVDLGTAGVNQGTISSQNSGRSISITGTNWMNAGTLSATNGGTLSLSGSWSNTGTLTVGSGSKLTLGGTFTLAPGGTLNNNGTVSISGTLNNAGNTLTLDGNTFSLAGGTIVGGTVNTTSGGATATGTLSGVVLGGNLTVPNGALTVTNGLTLAGSTITFSPASASSSLSFGGSGAQTLAGTGTILFGGYGSYTPYIGSSSALTILPGITVATSSNSGSISLGSTGVNRGTISSQTSGKSITVYGTNWTNTGTLLASNGGTLSLGGTIAAGGLGTFNSTGGTVLLNGTLNNAGNTLTLSGSGNTLTLGAGTISGGTINTTGGGALVIGNGSSGTLSGVVLGADLTVPNYSFPYVTGNLTLAGSTITLASTDSWARLNFAGGQTLGGTGTVLFGGSGSYNALNATGSGALTLGPNITVATSSGSGSVSLGSSGVNQGTISSQISHESITVTGTDWINTGTLSVGNGGTLSLNGPWTNSGTIDVGTGGKLILGGTLTTAFVEALISSSTFTNNGTVAIGGTINNSGNTLTLGGSTLSLAGGTIVGGTVTTTGGKTVAIGTLSGVTLGGNLTSSSLTVTNGLTVAGDAITLSSSSLNFSGNKTLGGTGTILFSSGYSRITSSGAITISSGVTIANGSSSGSISLGSSGINQGTISSQISISITGTNWINAGTLSASNGGTLSLNGSWNNAGTVSIDSSSTLVFTNASSPNGIINLSGTAILNYTGASPADTLRQQLALGRAGVTGIILPEAASDPTRAIGYAEASTLLGLSGFKTAIWSGQPVYATTLLLKPTLNGDANLDGVVNADDYALLDRSFAHGTTDAHWTDGDFDYSGVIDAADYLLIDSVFGQTHGFSPSFLAERESRFGEAYVSELLASVPEPSFLAVLSLPVLAGGRRRRCR